jgi:hypothetical protein
MHTNRVNFPGNDDLHCHVRSFLAHSRYLLHDGDGKFCPVFREVIQAGKVKPLKLPALSPNLNGFAERWVRSVKEECVSRLIFFGEHSLRRALTEYIDHFHRERNHQGKGNKRLFPAPRGPLQRSRAIGRSPDLQLHSVIARDQFEIRSI